MQNQNQQFPQQGYQPMSFPQSQGGNATPLNSHESPVQQPQSQVQPQQVHAQSYPMQPQYHAGPNLQPYAQSQIQSSSPPMWAQLNSAQFPQQQQSNQSYYHRLQAYGQQNHDQSFSTMPPPPQPQGVPTPIVPSQASAFHVFPGTTSLSQSISERVPGADTTDVWSAPSPWQNMGGAGGVGPAGTTAMSFSSVLGTPSSGSSASLGPVDIRNTSSSGTQESNSNDSSSLKVAGSSKTKGRKRAPKRPLSSSTTSAPDLAKELEEMIEANSNANRSMGQMSVSAFASGFDESLSRKRRKCDTPTMDVPDVSSMFSFGNDLASSSMAPQSFQFSVPFSTPGHGYPTMAGPAGQIPPTAQNIYDPGPSNSSPQIHAPDLSRHAVPSSGSSAKFIDGKNIGHGTQLGGQVVAGVKGTNTEGVKRVVCALMTELQNNASSSQSENPSTILREQHRLAKGKGRMIDPPNEGGSNAQIDLDKLHEGLIQTYLTQLTEDNFEKLAHIEETEDRSMRETVSLALAHIAINNFVNGVAKLDD